MTATYPSQVTCYSWRCSLIGLLGGVLALSLSACGSSPSSTLTAEVAPQPSTGTESTALLLRRKHPGTFDAEEFIARWDSAVAKLDPQPANALSLGDLVTFGGSLAYSLLFALETVTLAENLGSYGLLINQARPGGVDVTELQGILEAAVLLEQEVAALNDRATQAQQFLANRPTPTDPALAQSVIDLQDALTQTQASLTQIQTTLIDELDVILADEVFTSTEALILVGATTAQAGAVLAQAGIYTGLYNDQMNFCLSLDSLLSTLCAFLPSINSNPSPSPLGTPIPNL